MAHGVTYMYGFQRLDLHPPGLDWSELDGEPQRVTRGNSRLAPACSQHEPEQLELFTEEEHARQ